MVSGRGVLLWAVEQYRGPFSNRSARRLGKWNCFWPGRADAICYGCRKWAFWLCHGLLQPDTGCASAIILLFSAHSLLAVPRKLYKVDGHWLKFRLSWMYVGCNVCSGTRTAAWFEKSFVCMRAVCLQPAGCYAFYADPDVYAADIAYSFAGAAGCKVPSPTKHRKRSGNWCCHISGYDDTVFLCGLCVPAVCSLWSLSAARAKVERDLSVFDPGACGCCRNAAVFSVVVCAIAFTGKCFSRGDGHSCIGPDTVSHKNGNDANVAYA